MDLSAAIMLVTAEAEERGLNALVDLLHDLAYDVEHA